jgi:ATP-dependent Clp protease protease subunit
MKKKNKEEQQEETEIQDLSDAVNSFLILDDQPEPPKVRMLALYGEVDEESASELVQSLLILKDMGSREELEDPESEDSEVTTVYDPIDLIISTHGGLASEMYAIYDTIRMVRKDCDVCTFGIGKVMSAGVLLLASGTKGKRRISKNCRVMLHSVIGASHGSLHNLENEMDEIRYLQEQHINCLAEETDMTKNYLKKLMNKKVNVYLTAQEAVDLGIADEIV